MSATFCLQELMITFVTTLVKVIIMIHNKRLLIPEAEQMKNCFLIYTINSKLFRPVLNWYRRYHKIRRPGRKVGSSHLSAKVRRDGLRKFNLHDTSPKLLLYCNAYFVTYVRSRKITTLYLVFRIFVHDSREDCHILIETCGD